MLTFDGPEAALSRADPVRRVVGFCRNSHRGDYESAIERNPDIRICTGGQSPPRSEWLTAPDAWDYGYDDYDRRIQRPMSLVRNRSASCFIT